MQDRTPETRKPIVPRTADSLQLTFGYDLGESHGGVRLVRVERVRRIAPGISMPPPQPGQTGAWFEMRDADGALLYYQPLHDPMPTSREIFADDSGKPALSRAPIKKVTGEFQILVPDLPNATTFVFRATLPATASTQTQARAAGQAPSEAGELVRMSFDDVRRRAEPKR